jgi:tetratricopeptide (TPR) repeat protein
MKWTIPLALAAQVALPHAAMPQSIAPSAAFTFPTGAYSSVILAPPQLASDPADSLLRAASERMSRADYRGAAELYHSAVRRFPTSARLSEAMYYEAFALYRAGDLPRARGALDALRERFPQAAARGDANALRTRICGELARQGDSGCAEEVTRVSASATGRSDAARTSARSGAECPDGDDDDDTRIAALNALLQMDADRAMPILTTVLARRDRCSERLRRKAVFLVAQKQSAESANILLPIARCVSKPCSGFPRCATRARLTCLWISSTAMVNDRCVNARCSRCRSTPA